MDELTAREQALTEREGKFEEIQAILANVVMETDQKMAAQKAERERLDQGWQALKQAQETLVMPPDRARLPPWQATADSVAAAEAIVSPCQYDRLSAALTSSARLCGPPRLADSGWLDVDLQMKYEVVHVKASKVLMECGCRDGHSECHHCKHVCWLLMRVGGQLDWRVLGDKDHNSSLVPAVRRTWDNLQGLMCRARRPDAVANPADECPVCYEVFENTSCIQCDACSGLLHRACALRWARSCPLCRDPHQFAVLSG